LFNVIRGEMALIGPRPERPEFAQQLALHIPNYLERLTVLPGITGLAQINLPPDESLTCVRRKLALDLQYIATAGLFLDLRMFLCSATRLLGFSGEWSMWLFGIKRWVPKADDEESAEIKLDWLMNRSIAESSDDLDTPPPPASEWSDAALNGNGKVAAQNGFHSRAAVNDPASQQDHDPSLQNGANQVHSQNGADHNGAIHNGAAHQRNGHTKSGAHRFKIRD
jgi:hypothetical protein